MDVCVFQVGDTALHDASGEGYLTVVQTLLDTGADAGVQNTVSIVNNTDTHNDYESCVLSC